MYIFYSFTGMNATYNYLSCSNVLQDIQSSIY